MRKKEYRFFKKNAEKMAKKHDFWEQKNAPNGKKSCF
jgi:hypothetical protein